MKKGFIHIVEAVIMGVVVLLVLMQFSSIQMPKSDWSRTKLLLQGYDILSSAEKMVDWTNQNCKALLNDAIKNNFNLPANLIYTLRVEEADGTVDDIEANIVKNPVSLSMFKYLAQPCGSGPAEFVLSLGYRY